MPDTYKCKQATSGRLFLFSAVPGRAFIVATGHFVCLNIASHIGETRDLIFVTETESAIFVFCFRRTIAQTRERIVLFSMNLGRARVPLQRASIRVVCESYDGCILALKVSGSPRGCLPGLEEQVTRRPPTENRTCPLAPRVVRKSMKWASPQ